MRPDIDSIERLTDVYFNKTKETVRRFGDKKVTYALFMRRPVIAAPASRTAPRIWTVPS